LGPHGNLLNTLLIRLIVLVGAAAVMPAAAAAEKFIFGWVEQVAVQGAAATLEAKLDTGATTSSIDAREIYRFRRGKKRFVRFQLPGGDGISPQFIERPLVRMVRIKQHDGQYQRRPVVALGVCLGRIWRDVEFSLVDRSNFDHPVLLGRNALAGSVLVDADLVRTTPPSCNQWPLEP
jgi:hypothetical protein